MADGGIEAGGVVAATASLLTIIGGGIAWLFRRRDVTKRSREDKLHAWQAELEAKERRIDEGRTAYVERLETRLGLLEAKDEARDTQMTALRISFELVSSALRQIDHTNSALGLADDLLRTAFPVPPSTPPDMAVLLNTIDQRGAK